MTVRQCDEDSPFCQVFVDVKIDALDKMIKLRFKVAHEFKADMFERMWKRCSLLAVWEQQKSNFCKVFLYVILLLSKIQNFINQIFEFSSSGAGCLSLLVLALGFRASLSRVQIPKLASSNSGLLTLIIQAPDY